MHKIYEVFIVGLLERGLFIESIPFLHRILSVTPPLPHEGIIYVMMLVGRIAPEFNEESRKCLFRLAAVLFYEPLMLLKAIDFTATTKLTGLEQTRCLRDLLTKEAATRSNFSADNPTISKFISQNYTNPKTAEVV